MESSERKKRVTIAVVGAVIALAFLGNFFWSFFKDFFHARPNGGQQSKTPLFIFGGFFLYMALMVVFSVWRGIRNISREDSATALPRDPQPWLARADWAAGKIKSTASAQVKLFTLMAVAFCGLGGLFTFTALPKALTKGNDAALLVLIFPAIGLGFVVAIVRAVRAHRRFGDCFLKLAQVPAPLGGSLDGMIQTGARFRLEHGLHLKISCIRRVVTGSGKNQSTQETVLWQDEKVFKPESDLPEPEPGHSGIPVFFKLPADQPECFAHGREAVLWRLEAKAKMSGPDFAATFEVPVFQFAGTVPVAEATEPDPTAALQMPVEEIRRDENSKIKVTDGPAGREFYFPAARNLGTVLRLTAFFLVWSAFVYFMLHAKDCPRFFPIVFGLVDVFIFWGCFNLWLKSSRVTVNPTRVIAVNRWLIFSRTRQFDASDIARFATKTGMQSGSTIFTDIRLVRVGADAAFAEKAKSFAGGPPASQLVAERFRQAAGPSGVTVANSIANGTEAAWLVAEMNKALGRKS